MTPGVMVMAGGKRKDKDILGSKTLGIWYVEKLLLMLLCLVFG